MKKDSVIRIWVYADWSFLNGPKLIGILSAMRVRGKEIFSFEYDESWLTSDHNALFLDPHLGLYKGKQYLPDDKCNFGVFLDSSPDRWGRMLMRRREAYRATLQNRQAELLFESDYLLGVQDGHRIGGLRFKLEPEGDFVSKVENFTTPPWTSMRELEYASLQLERDEASQKPDYLKWLNQLFYPGSSLGGARPKAIVADTKGQLWIAKFPSLEDDKDSGSWEMVLNKLAKDCGITVPEAALHKFTGKHHTYFTKRFDRKSVKKRLHYASAMTMLAYEDGVNAQDGVSYLEIAGFIIQHGADVKTDLIQLWKRIVFNILVSNTDDHLRNHGFILKENGWRLSPAYDMNPNEFGNGLSLNITENSNQLNMDLAMETAIYYRLKDNEAKVILDEMLQKVSQWSLVAKKYGIPKSEIEMMRTAFKIKGTS